MAFPTKLAIASILGTGLVGGGVGTIYLLQNNQEVKEVKEVTSIEQQLGKEKKTLIKGSDKSAFWTIKFSTFKKEVEKKALGVTLATQDENGVKAWCEANISSNFIDKNQNTYKAVKELCVVPTNREKLLSADQTITSDWEGKANTYKSEGNGENVIEKFGSTQPTKQQIEEWCKEEIEKEFKVDTEKSYKLSLKWCTVKGK